MEDESETVWIDAEPAFVERLAREAKLEGETIAEFVEGSIENREG